jgi:hypothetical protein
MVRIALINRSHLFALVPSQLHYELERIIEERVKF